MRTWVSSSGRFRGEYRTGVFQERLQRTGSTFGLQLFSWRHEKSVYSIKPFLSVVINIAPEEETHNVSYSTSYIILLTPHINNLACIGRRLLPNNYLQIYTFIKYKGLVKYVEHLALMYELNVLLQTSSLPHMETFNWRVILTTNSAMI